MVLEIFCCYVPHLVQLLHHLTKGNAGEIRKRLDFLSGHTNQKTTTVLVLKICGVMFLHDYYFESIV